jgi:hypothetical protein
LLREDRKTRELKKKDNMKILFNNVVTYGLNKDNYKKKKPNNESRLNPGIIYFTDVYRFFPTSNYKDDT